MEDTDECDFFKLGGSIAAIKKRNVQLESWKSSVTNEQPDYILPTRSTAKVKFGNVDAFLGAVKSGDTDEVRRLLEEKAADVNSRNSDQLTALHRTCIEGDIETTRLLIEHGADVNIQDIDGWTPLHGAASCGHTQIARVLLDNNAFPAIVSNDGETPSDLAEDNDIILNMIKEKIEEQHIDIEALKNAEENAIMEDAIKMKDSTISLVGTDGVTPLHVAAAKNYTNVLKVLLSVSSVKTQLNAEDKDGWTPLHAAVFWGNMEIAEQLVQSGADLMRMTQAGETVDDLCDPEYKDELENLMKIADKGDGLLGSSYHGGSPLGQGDEGRLPPVLMRSFSRETPPRILRRRISKEVLMHDMTKEREEREMFSPEAIEEVDLPNGHMESNGESPSPAGGNPSIDAKESTSPVGETPPQKRWEAWSHDTTNGEGNTLPVDVVNSELSNDLIDTNEEGFVQEDNPSKNVGNSLPEELDEQCVLSTENSLSVVSENGIEEVATAEVDRSAEGSLKAEMDFVQEEQLEGESDLVDNTSLNSSAPVNDAEQQVRDNATTGDRLLPEPDISPPNTVEGSKQDPSFGKVEEKLESVHQAVEDTSSQTQQQETIITEPPREQPDKDGSSTTPSSPQSRIYSSPLVTFLVVAAMAVVVGVLIRQMVTL